MRDEASASAEAFRHLAVPCADLAHTRSGTDPVLAGASPTRTMQRTRVITSFRLDHRQHTGEGPVEESRVLTAIDG